MPKPLFFILQGTTFDLSHLTTIRQKTNAKLRAGTKDVVVEISFSCHCWSRSPLADERIPPTHFIADGSKEKPRNRIFCASRYELSLSLPQVVTTMLTRSGLIYKTYEENIVRIDLLVPVIAGAPLIKYYVFMKMEKRSPEGAQKYIRIFVESAYPDSVMYDKQSFGKPFSFAQLIGDCWEGRYPNKNPKQGRK